MPGIHRRIVEKMRSWLRSIVDRDTTEAAGVQREERRCGICKTPVSAGESTCPLCGSSDIRSADAVDTEPAPTPEPETTRSAGTDATVERLAAVRGERDAVLSAYVDRYSGIADGESKYEVTLPNGSTTRVADRTELRETLLREYGPPDSGRKD